MFWSEVWTFMTGQPTNLKVGLERYTVRAYARVVQYEHYEYLQSKKWGGRHAPLRASGSKKMRRHVPPCLNGIAAYAVVDNRLVNLLSNTVTALLTTSTTLRNGSAST